MRADRVISTIDFHTAGIGMRLVTSGLGRIPGATIGEKRRWFQENLDHVRTGLCLEPSGPETPVTIDTEAGVVETVARSAGGRVREVTLRWTPSFVALAAQIVEVE